MKLPRLFALVAPVALVAAACTNDFDQFAPTGEDAGAADGTAPESTTGEASSSSGADGTSSGSDATGGGADGSGADAATDVAGDVQAETGGGDAHGDGPADAPADVPAEAKSCGADLQACCPGANPCDSPGACCDPVGSTCVAANQACGGANEVCVNGTCTTCGTASAAPCCTGSYTSGGNTYGVLQCTGAFSCDTIHDACVTSGSCANGTSRDGVCCGSNGEPCCQGLHPQVCPHSTNKTCSGATSTNPGTCN
jgi:hypothetical protein